MLFILIECQNVVAIEQYYKVIKLMTFEWFNNLIEFKKCLTASELISIKKFAYNLRQLKKFSSWLMECAKN